MRGAIGTVLLDKVRALMGARPKLFDQRAITLLAKGFGEGGQILRSG